MSRGVCKVCGRFTTKGSDRCFGCKEKAIPVKHHSKTRKSKYSNYGHTNNFYCNGCGLPLQGEPTLFEFEGVILRFCNEDCMVQFLEKRNNEK